MVEVNAESIALTSRALYWWPRRFLKKRHMTECKRLAFKVSMTIMDVFTVDGISLNHNEYEQFQNSQLDTMAMEFEWKITDYKVIENLKSAANGMGFDSPVFDAFGYKWCLQLFPSGYNADNRESVDLFLYLVSVPPDIDCIAVNYTMTMKELMVDFSYSEQFSKENFLTGWPYNVVKILDIQNLKTLSFAVTMHLFEVYDLNGHPVVSTKWMANSSDVVPAKTADLPSGQYVWCIENENDLKQIKDPNIRRGFTSPYFEMYGLKWFLQFFNMERPARAQNRNTGL